MLSAEAVRMGKAAATTETVTAVGVASGAFLAANPNRIAFIISPSGTNNYTVSTKATAVAGQGIFLVAGTGQPFRVGIEDYGSAVAGAWTAIASGGAISINVLEVILQTG